MLEYYNKKKYSKVDELIEQIQPAFRGSEKAENIAYIKAQSSYKQKDYITAASNFRSFANAFPTSKNAEEANFLSAYCSYKESPRSSLDQTNTLNAMNALELFKRLYPKSDKVPEANRLLDELQTKLEKKDLDIALLYYKMDDYLAASTSFKNFIKDYPESQFKEQALYYILKCKFEVAQNTIYQNQKERFIEASEAYDEYISSFPTGQYTDRAKALNAVISKYVPADTKKEETSNQ